LGVRVIGNAANIPPMTRRAVYMAVILVLGLTWDQNAAGQRPGVTCPNPSIKCDSTYSFAPHQLPFVIKDKLVFGKAYKSVFFYAVILKSVKTRAESDCVLITEEERTAAQSDFVDRKVFASRHSCPEELVFYEIIAPDLIFMAVYAGSSAATAKRMLTRVRATGRYPQAYIKQLRVVLDYST
jgi:hypothetical protein